MHEVASEPGDRREVILTAAAELFARQGVASTSVREIAESVGILSGSLYHHFRSKQSIVEEILTTYLEDLQKAYELILASGYEPDERLRRLITASIATSVSHPRAAEIYQNDSRYLAEQSAFTFVHDVGTLVQDALFSVIDDGVRLGVFRADVDAKVFYRLLRDGMWRSVRWFRPTADYTVEKFTADIATVYLDGFRTSL